MRRSIRKALFPVAGLGTRLLPATRMIPKEMLPVVDRPLIQYAVEEAIEAGIEEFIFVIGTTAMAPDHFRRAGHLDEALAAAGRDADRALAAPIIPDSARITQVRQTRPLGLGHAIWCAREEVGGEPVAILLPDDLILAEPGCLRQMVDAWQDTGGNMLAVATVPRQDISSYGVIRPGRRDGTLIELRGLVEKPAPREAPSTYAVVGRYIIEPGVFSLLERFETGAGGEIQLTDALAQRIGQVPSHACVYSGRRFDCGSRIGLLEASIAVALSRDDLRESVLSRLRASL